MTRPGECKGGQVHRDAERIRDFLLEKTEHGYTTLPNEEVARKISFTTWSVTGAMSVDMKRWRRAIAHIHDGRDKDGSLCCVYDVNYRSSNRDSIFALIDPKADRGKLMFAGLGEVLGALLRMLQHRTENRRLVQQFELVAAACLQTHEIDAYRLWQRAIAELDGRGSISSDILGELVAWAEGLAS